MTNSATPGDALLSVRHLTKSYGKFCAIADVSLDVQNCSAHGLIGPNGAGKSTLLQLVAGRYKADSGSVLLSSTDVSRLSVHARARLGLMLKLQVSSVFPTLSVRENLQLGLNARSRQTSPGDSMSIDEVLELVQLSNRETTFAGHLAHGEAKWLELGMILLCSPRLLLLDEPAAGMTRAEGHRIAALIRTLLERAVIQAVLVVEHDMDFVRLVCDRVTVLHRGRVLAQGTHGEVAADRSVQSAYLGRTE